VKVFISWSGEQSRQVALALYTWLPQAIHAANPYMSEKGNEAGSLWDHILSYALEESNFGIVCLTPSNLESRWLNFEAGALSKAVTQARVVPLLYGLTSNDVGLPLSRFMMKRADKEGMWETVVAMNSHVEEERRLPESVLLGTFDSLWPKLAMKLNSVSAGPEARKRSDRELLEEILELIRGSHSRNRELTELERLLDVAALTSPDLAARLKQIAGPNGYVWYASSGPHPAVMVRVPNPADISEDDQSVLTLIREYLAHRGVGLKVVEDYRD
jgi:hypothetical protein